MARIRSEFKTCRGCKLSLKLAWAKDSGKGYGSPWRLAIAKIDPVTGKVCRDDAGSPIPDRDASGAIRWHACEPGAVDPVKSESKPEPGKVAEPEPESKPEPEPVKTRKVSGAGDPFAGFAAWVDDRIETRVAKINVAGYKPPAIIINGKPWERAATDQAPVHYLFPKIMRLMLLGKHVLLWGGPGAGKSYLANQIAHALIPEGFKNPAFKAMSKDISVNRIEGYIRPHDGKYQETPEFLAYRDGGVYVADEAANAPASVLMLFNALMANREHTFPGSNVPVPKSPFFRMILADNTPGHGGTRGHESRQAIDASTLNRVFSIEFKIDEDLEDALALGKPYTPRKPRPVTPGDPEAWVSWVRAVRRYLSERNTSLRLVATPRASIEGAAILRDGSFTFAEVAEGLVFQGCGEDARKSILSACPFP